SVTTDGDGNASFNATLPIAARAGQVVTATATDPDGNTSEFSLAVAVAQGNVLPVITSLDGPSVGVRGLQLHYTGSFSDPDADTWTGTVTFGDGTRDQPLALNTDKTFAFQHVFATSGIYTVTVSIADNHGAVGTRSLDVKVVGTTGNSPPVARDDTAL